MMTILKNNYRRLATRKGQFILMLLLTAAAIAAAIFMSGKSENIGTIAYVANEDAEPAMSGNANIKVMSHEPAYSDLVSAKYAAIVIPQADGEYEIKTIKNDEFKVTLLAALTNQEMISEQTASHRGPGATIIGFLIMFLLLESSVLMSMFSEDKENHQIERVVATPITMKSYLLSHSIFNFAFLFCSTMVILGAAKLITGADLGYSFIQYAILISLICLLGTAFSLFLNAIAKKSDSATMAGSASIMLTSVLAGSFYSFEKGNELLEKIIRFLPQKAFLNFAQGVEDGIGFSQNFQGVIYIAVLIVVFFVLAVVKTRKDYVAGY